MRAANCSVVPPAGSCPASRSAAEAPGQQLEGAAGGDGQDQPHRALLRVDRTSKQSQPASAVMVADDTMRHALTRTRRRGSENAFMETSYSKIEPTRDEVDKLSGATLLEFGTSWCGWCRGAQPSIREALAAHPQLRHIKVEDGPGQPLGRSFRVKLWPTLILMNNGAEVARLVRPADARAIGQALAQLA